MRTSSATEGEFLHELEEKMEVSGAGSAAPPAAVTCTGLAERKAELCNARQQLTVIGWLSRVVWEI